MKITNQLMVCCTVFIQSYKPWWSIYSFAVFVSLSAKPCTHAFIHPSRKSSSLSFGVVVGDRMFLWSYNLKVAKIWLFFFPSFLPSKAAQIIQPTAFITHVPLFKLIFILILSSPSFQRPEDNGTPYDAIVLTLFLSVFRRWRFKVLF